MARPRTPLAAWIKQQRGIAGWKSEELARRVGVSESTVRGWESGRTVGPDNLAAMERLFGLEAPGKQKGEAAMDLASAIERNTAAVSALVDLLRPLAEAQALQVAHLQVAVREMAERLARGVPEETPARGIPRAKAE